jgi:hypothetical protein
LSFIAIEDCVESGLDICLACENYGSDEYEGCYFKGQREYIKSFRDAEIMKCYFDELKSLGIHSELLYFLYNAIKIDRPHLIEKIDKLMVLI